MTIYPKYTKFGEIRLLPTPWHLPNDLFNSLKWALISSSILAVAEGGISGAYYHKWNFLCFNREDACHEQTGL